MPAEVRAIYEDPASSYNFGWSQGKETLEGGQPDTNKGSYYANPALDRPTEDPQLLREYPAYCRSGRGKTEAGMVEPHVRPWGANSCES